MKIYDFVGAPNPKKLRIYLAEKGLADDPNIELVPVNFLEGEHREEEFRRKNPMAALPVLELDDGRCFNESLAIIEYIEELHPHPNMIGESAEERLRIRGIERHCELAVLANIGRIVWNTHPFFAKRISQTEAAADNGRRLLQGSLKVLDGIIGDNPFVAGERVTIADCTLFAALWFGRAMSADADLSKRPNIQRWLTGFRQRPSRKA